MCPVWTRRIIIISILTGLRINELLNLEWSSVDFERDTIMIGNTDTFKTKTRRERTIPINSLLRPYLLWLKDEFIDTKKDEIKKRGIANL